MKTTKRFEKAISKLYYAFHEGTLDAMDCEACAVGNILGHGDWGSNYIPEEGMWNGPIRKYFYQTSIKNNSGYSLKELGEVERRFLNVSMKNGKYIEWNRYNRKKEIQFKGLCAVVEYLCELDNIPNIMDYTFLFETENNKPLKELTF